MSHFAAAALVTLALSLPAALGLVVTPNALDGTKYSTGLTQKQLALLRTFAELTFLSDSDDWHLWPSQSPDCDGEGASHAFSLRFCL